MKLVVLHGPPAVGKLTVARELARLTGWRLFHNHLVVDALLAQLPDACDRRDAIGKERGGRPKAHDIAERVHDLALHTR